MRTQGVFTLLLGIALGSNLVLGAWLFHASTNDAPVAVGQTVDTNGRYSVATGRIAGRGDADALYIWDAEEQRLAVYFVQGKKMDLIFARDCGTDFSVPQFGEQYPRSTWNPKDEKTWRGKK